MHEAPGTTGKLQSGDVEIFYRKFGSLGATPILILHGLSYFSYDWIDVAKRLSHDREVVAMDLRGFGDSGWSSYGDYGLRTFAADVIALLDHLQWPKANLLGHSMGGRIAFCTAAWNSTRIERLALADFAPDVAAAGRRKVAERIGRQPDWFTTVDEALTYHGHSATLPAEDPVRQRFELFLRQEEQGLRLKRDLYFRDSFAEILRTGKAQPTGVDLWQLLSDLKAPTLFMRGATSDMFAAETVAKIHATAPCAEVIELPGGHDMLNDAPDELIAATERFFAGIQSA